MKGLLLKDMYNLKGYTRQYLILLIFFMIFGISMGNSHYIMWMSLVLGLNLGFASFPFDEEGGYAYMLSCPVGRKTMVQAKYLLGLISGAAILLCSAVGEILSRLINGKVTEAWMVEMLFVLGVYFLFTSVLTPVSYHFGVEKSRVVMLGMVAVPMVAIFLSLKLVQISTITEMLKGVTRLFTQEQIIYGGAFLFLIVGLLFLAGSYLLSLKIFSRKEF